MNRRSPHPVGLRFALACLLAVLEACASPAVFNPLPDNQRAFEAVREVLARQLGLDPLVIRLVETVPVDWPDACVGLPAAGEICAQVVTPGFRVVVETDGTSYEFRTNHDGSLVRPNAQ